MVARPEDLFWNDEADFKIRRTVQGIDVTGDKLVRAGFYLTNEQKKIMSASAGVKTECLLSVNLIEVFENRTRAVDAMLSQSRSGWRDVDCDHCAATPGPFKYCNGDRDPGCANCQLAGIVCITTPKESKA